MLGQESHGGSLVPSARPQLVNCDPASKVPCFRLRLNILDSARRPLSLQLPNPAELTKSLQVNVNGQTVAPFYAMAGTNGPARAMRGRIALVLIDVSGSMNERVSSEQTRFEAAQKAAERFLDGFENGVDQVAFIPFQSRNVIETIENAKFATKREEALQQISDLPVPRAQNNTALYSAMVAGADRLQRAVRTFGHSTDALMITMTDGKNDVGGRRDDPNLLDGQHGLATAESKVKNSGLESITIGFGNPGSIDANALNSLGTTTYMVEQPDELKRIFNTTRTLLNDRLMLTFSSPWKDRASLAGQTLTIFVSLRLPSGATLQSGPILWTTPQIGTPSYEGRCDAEESTAVLRTPVVTEVTGWLTILRPMLVTLGYAALFLVLWFWLPQLIWPGRELGGLHSIHYRRRWGNPTATKNFGRPAVKAPTGFGKSDGPQVPYRTPADATFVQMPISDTSRSRLYPIRGAK
jgi:hypothetical protein